MPLAKSESKLRQRILRRMRDVLRAPVRAGRGAARMLRNEPFPLDVAARAIVWGRLNPDYWARAHMLKQCLRADADGEPYYRIGGRRYYFRPHFRVDERELREGVELILRERYLAPEPEPEEARVRPGDVVLDLGGNIGTMALHFGEQAGPTGCVYSFEPIMHRPLALNARRCAYGNIEVVPLAVAEQPGAVRFRVRGNCIDSRIAPSAACEGAQEMQVPATSIDEFVRQRRLQRVDVIKSDIEGGEEPAMLGAAQTVERFRPRWIISSYHTDIEGRAQHPRLVSLLRGWGYEVHEIESRRIYAW